MPNECLQIAYIYEWTLWFNVRINYPYLMFNWRDLTIEVYLLFFALIWISRNVPHGFWVLISTGPYNKKLLLN